MSQVKKMWSGLVRRLGQFQIDLGLSRSLVNLHEIVMQRYLKAYHPVGT